MLKLPFICIFIILSTVALKWTLMSSDIVFGEFFNHRFLKGNVLLAFKAFAMFIAHMRSCTVFRCEVDVG